MLVLLGVVLITGYQLRFWVQGPVLEIASNQLVTETGSVPIVFVVHNTEQVLVNGTTVIPQIDGLVRTNLYVPRGKSITSIDLYDKYGSHKREYLYIVYPHVGENTD